MPGATGGGGPADCFVFHLHRHHFTRQFTRCSTGIVRAAGCAALHTCRLCIPPFPELLHARSAARPVPAPGPAPAPAGAVWRLQQYRQRPSHRRVAAGHDMPRLRLPSHAYVRTALHLQRTACVLGVQARDDPHTEAVALAVTWVLGRRLGSGCGVGLGASGPPGAPTDVATTHPHPECARAGVHLSPSPMRCGCDVLMFACVAVHLYRLRYRRSAAGYLAQVWAGLLPTNVPANAGARAADARGELGVACATASALAATASGIDPSGVSAGLHNLLHPTLLLCSRAAGAQPQHTSLRCPQAASPHRQHLAHRSRNRHACMTPPPMPTTHARGCQPAVALHPATCDGKGCLRQMTRNAAICWHPLRRPCTWRLCRRPPAASTLTPCPACWAAPTAVSHGMVISRCLQPRTLPGQPTVT